MDNGTEKLIKVGKKKFYVVALVAVVPVSVAHVAVVGVVIAVAVAAAVAVVPAVPAADNNRLRFSKQLNIFSSSLILSTMIFSEDILGLLSFFLQQ